MTETRVGIDWENIGLKPKSKNSVSSWKIFQQTKTSKTSKASKKVVRKVRVYKSSAIRQRIHITEDPSCGKRTSIHFYRLQCGTAVRYGCSTNKGDTIHSLCYRLRNNTYRGVNENYAAGHNIEYCILKYTKTLEDAQELCYEHRGEASVINYYLHCGVCGFYMWKIEPHEWRLAYASCIHTSFKTLVSKLKNRTHRGRRFITAFQSSPLQVVLLEEHADLQENKLYWVEYVDRVNEGLEPIPANVSIIEKKVSSEP